MPHLANSRHLNSAPYRECHVTRDWPFIIYASLIISQYDQ